MKTNDQNLTDDQRNKGLILEEWITFMTDYEHRNRSWMDQLENEMIERRMMNDILDQSEVYHR